MNKKKVVDIWLVLLFFTLMFLPLTGYGETPPPGKAAAQNPQVKLEKGKFSRVSEKGLFKALMVMEGQELVEGKNSLILVIRDGNDRELTGAQVEVAPWMPEHGHGVWEKPVVTERGQGNYRVENIVLIMSGKWDLKITVKKGTEEDRAVFTFLVGVEEKSIKEDPEKPKKYSRTMEDYKVPNVTLLNQDGKKISLKSLLDSGKPAVIDFIFTTCTTICPVLSTGFSGLRDELGKEADRVQLVSISIDPDHDRPQQMKKYLKRYNAGEGWEFLTGSRADINIVLKAFDAYVQDKMFHQPLYIFHGPNSDKWIRTNGLMSKSDLLKELRSIDNK